MDYECWIGGEFDRHFHPVYNYTDPTYQGERYLINKFYVWIVPLLLLHALCFIVPRIHWHFKQEQVIPKCLKKLPTKELSDDWINQRTQLIAYIKNIGKSHHRLFAIKYLFCEFITIIINILVMAFMNLVIDDFWDEYRSAAYSLLTLDFHRFYKDSSRLFPKQASCHFYTYDLNRYTRHGNSVCYFPQNSLNDKIFAILYIWYIFIITWAILHLFVMIALYSIKCLQFKQIRRMIGRPVTACECQYLSGNGDFGIWFTLRIFRRNMHLAHFQDLCTGLLSETVCPTNP